MLRRNKFQENLNSPLENWMMPQKKKKKLFYCIC